VATETLIEKSFEFLLEREPNTKYFALDLFPLYLSCC